MRVSVVKVASEVLAQSKTPCTLILRIAKEIIKRYYHRHHEDELENDGINVHLYEYFQNNHVDVRVKGSTSSCRYTLFFDGTTTCMNITLKTKTDSAQYTATLDLNRSTYIIYDQ